MTLLSFNQDINHKKLKVFTYQSTTDDIVVTLKPVFSPEESQNQSEPIFVWYYHVTIENHGEAPCQLIKRFWKIMDSNANVSEVKGKGVGGEQPILNPGESFEYTSAVPLPTPSGFMTGYFTMESVEGKSFEVQIPTFSLDSPYINLSVH